MIEGQARRQLARGRHRGAIRPPASGCQTSGPGGWASEPRRPAAVDKDERVRDLGLRPSRGRERESADLQLAVGDYPDPGGRGNRPAFDSSGTLSPAQTKSRKVLAALLIAVSAGQQPSRPSYCSAELYRGVAFRLWDSYGDRRRSVRLWGFCGGLRANAEPRPVLPLHSL
jgi:hypothetical protein